MLRMLMPERHAFAISFFMLSPLMPSRHMPPPLVRLFRHAAVTLLLI